MTGSSVHQGIAAARLSTHGLSATRKLSVAATRMKSMAPDSSKGSALATFTPKPLATRGTGQAGTQRAAEHGSLPIYPTTPVALDHC